MRKVIVTGSQGFIGSYVCKDLLDSGYQVVGIDNYSKYGKLPRSHDKHPNFTLLEEDIINWSPRHKGRGFHYSWGSHDWGNKLFP